MEEDEDEALIEGEMDDEVKKGKGVLQGRRRAEGDGSDKTERNARLPKRLIIC